MLGPVQVLVVGFDEPSYSGEVLAELTKLEAAGIVWLIDLLVVAKTADGIEPVKSDALSSRGGDLVAALLTDPMDAAADPPAEPSARDESTWSLADALAPGQTAAVALLEHTWASSLREAIRRNGGRPLDETWLAPDDLGRLESLLAQDRA